MNILFWSGGKDAYLALKRYQHKHPRAKITLLTTYRERDNVVPQQNIALSDIKKQADHLNLPLITVPLPDNCPNEAYLQTIRHTLDELSKPVEELIFGDWHLEDIRAWREEAFGAMGYGCVFPIWERPLQDLLPKLWFLPVEVNISSVQEEFRSFIQVGETYNHRFVQQLLLLDRGIDLMGENGEFHTSVIFQESNDPRTTDNL